MTGWDRILTYLIALIVLLGSGVLLVIVPESRFGQLLPFITAVDGAVIAYVFAREQTQVVQAGNGLERMHLSEVSQKLDTVLLNTPVPAPAPSVVQTDSMDVEAGRVELRP